MKDIELYFLAKRIEGKGLIEESKQMYEFLLDRFEKDECFIFASECAEKLGLEEKAKRYHDLALIDVPLTC